MKCVESNLKNKDGFRRCSELCGYISAKHEAVFHIHTSKFKVKEEELKRMGSKSSPSMVALAIVLQHVTCRVVQVQAGRDAAKSFAADSRVLRGGGKGGPAIPLVPTLGIDLNLAFQLPAKCNLSLLPQC
ncbi:hypothetical protein HN873_030845 [Arachis hypogaea]